MRQLGPVYEKAKKKLKNEAITSSIWNYEIKRKNRKMRQLGLVHVWRREKYQKMRQLGLPLPNIWRREKKNRKMRQLGLVYEEEKKIKKWGIWVQYVKKLKKSKNEAIAASWWCFRGGRLPCASPRGGLRPPLGLAESNVECSAELNNYTTSVAMVVPWRWQ